MPLPQWLNSLTFLPRRTRIGSRPTIRPRLSVEALEDRTLLAAVLVTNTLDSGAGSLRQAILDANAHLGADAITFNIPSTDAGFVDVDSSLSGGDAAPDVFAIRLLSALPALSDATGGTTIDGRTQTAFGGDTNPFGPEIVLDGSAAGNGTNVLTITSNNNVVAGLNIHSYSDSGVAIIGASGNRVSGSYIGTDATGTTVMGGYTGVLITGGSTDNIVGTNGDGMDDAAEGNLMSGNFANMVVKGVGADNNIIAGNLIGSDRTGTVALSNPSDNVVIVQGASNNRVGTNGDGVSDVLERNVIVGAHFSGIAIFNDNTDNNIVAGNYVGVDVTGTKALGNGFGVLFGYSYGGIGQHNTRIGTNSDGVSDAIERNVISGNGRGIVMDLSSFTLVAGNYIGTDATGTLAIGNGDGISILGHDNTIGGPTASARNLISGNGTGIGISGTGAYHNVVAGNYIGTDVTGTVALGNTGDGIHIDSATNNTIGGITPGAGNVISGNVGDGIEAADTIDSNGPALAVDFLTNANPGRVFGTLPTSPTDLSAEVFASYTSTLLVVAVRVTDDFIDAQPSDAASPFSNDGVELFIDADRTANDFVPGSPGREGMQLVADTLGNQFTNAEALSNKDWSVSTRLITGGYEIEFQIPLAILDTQDGPGFTPAAPGSNLRFNLAVVDNDALVSVQQTYGILWRNGSELPVATGEPAWVVDLFLDDGSSVVSSAPLLISAPHRGNTIEGNLIGTNVTGSGALANAGSGINLNNASGNLVGGGMVAARNVISGNAQNGVLIQGSGAAGNEIVGNYIGTDATGTVDLGNRFDGVAIWRGARGNRVGTNGDGVGDSDERNLISGNNRHGVDILSAGTVNNVVAGNYIGTDESGTVALRNTGAGIQIDSGATSNCIGTNGDGVGDAAEANTIAFNAGAGVEVTNNGTTGNSIRGNSFFSNGGLGIDLNGDGVTANDSGDADAGPNDLQNFPVIRAAKPGATTHVVGTLDGAPDSGFLIDFYANSAPDPSGYGEGQRYLGSTILVTDAAGHADFTIDLSAATSSSEWITTTATDAAGNTSEFSAAVAVDNTPPQVLDMVDISPDPRNVGVSAVDVLFSEPIDITTLDAADLTLALNGVGQLLTGPLTFTPSTGNPSLVTIGGLQILTGANGTYTLTVDGTGIKDLAGNAGFGLASDSWLTDAIAPLSQVNALPRRATSLTFDVSISGSDPVLAGGTPSGLSAFDVYVSMDGAAYTLWKTLPAASPSAAFTAQSNRTYAFQSFAHDLAGNVESKPAAVEASTYVPDLDGPVTQVDSVDATTATFTVNISGSDSGGSKLAFIDLFVSVDGGPIQNVNTVNTRSVASYSGMVSYQAIADGSSHSYRFYTVGIDGNANIEATPTAPADVLVTATFAAPQALQVMSFDVQKGALQRSYVRYLDIAFNAATGLQGIVDSLNDADSSNDRIKLTQFDLNGGNGSARTLTAAMLTIVGQTIQIDFGPAGIGGNPNSNAGDGYYGLTFDLDGDLTPDSDLNFYRLFGDTNGDRIVNSIDLASINAAFGQSGPALDADINGDGLINILDRMSTFRALGRSINSSLPLDD